MKLHLPERKIMIISVIVSVIVPAHFIIFFMFPPENYEFTGMYAGEASDIWMMRSVDYNFDNPWALDGSKAYQSPLLTSPFLYIPIGMLAKIASIDYAIMHIAIRAILTMTYLIVIYNVITFFCTKKEAGYALIIFLLAAGLGGTFQLANVILTDKPIEAYSGNLFPSTYGLSYDETGVTALSQTYHPYRLLGFVLGYLSILFAFRREILKSGMFLGLSVIFYPNYAAMFALFILLLYAIRAETKNFIKTASIAAPFTIPWMLLFLSRQDNFAYYATGNDTVILPTLLISLGIPFLIACFGMGSRLRYNKNLLILTLISALLFSLSQIENIYSVNNTLGGFGLKVPFLVISGLFVSHVIYINRAKTDEKYIFLASMLLVSMYMSLVPPEIAIWQAARFMNFMWVPISILAAKGILELKTTIKPEKVLIIVLALSLPWLISFNLSFQLAPRSEDGMTFVHNDDMEALRYLKDLPYGNVLATTENLGVYVPHFSGKRSIIGLDTSADYKARFEDYRTFMEHPEARSYILHKYSVRYVISAHESNVDVSGLGLNLLFSKGDVRIYSREL